MTHTDERTVERCRIVQQRVAAPVDAVDVEPLTRRAPGRDEVVVALIASPINPADMLRLRGEALLGDLPAVAGGEGAGRVIACGDAVRGVAVGDLVLLPPGGTWADEHVCSASDVIPLPPETPVEQAAMLSINPMTAACLLDLAPLRPGDWIIQNAAASAVAQLIVRLARRRDIRTLNVVRSERDRTMLQALGATAVLVGEDDLAVHTRDATRGEPIVLGLDAIAGKSSARMAECLAEGGLLVVYGLLSGQPIELPTVRIVFHGISVRGFSRVRAVRAMGRDAARSKYAELARMVTAGELTTNIGARYPLVRVKDALRHAEAERQGKILLLGPAT